MPPCLFMYHISGLDSILDSSEGYYSSNVRYTDQKLRNLSNEGCPSPEACSHLAEGYGWVLCVKQNIHEMMETACLFVLIHIQSVSHCYIK